MKLKFELVNGFGVLVDNEVEIKSDEFYISWEDDYATPKWVIYCKSTGLNGKNPMKIIFAEKELGIDVLVFEWRDFELENNPEIHDWVQEVILKEGKHWNDQDALEPVYYGVIKGYKSNPAKYTEEDLRKITQASFIVMSNPETVIADFDRWFEKRLQSLQKYPKYVVMESEYDCCKRYVNCKGCDATPEMINYRPKLFTNSDGKQQGTVKELIWD
jgi:hypothetical protein